MDLLPMLAHCNTYLVTFIAVTQSGASQRVCLRMNRIELILHCWFSDPKL